MKKIFRLILFSYIIICSCSSHKTTIKNKIYLNSYLVEGLEIGEGEYIIYKHKEYNKTETKIILITIKDKSILFTGSSIKLDDFNYKLDILYYVFKGNERSLSRSFKGEVTIQEFINEKNLSFDLKLKCLDKEGLDIDKVIKF